MRVVWFLSILVVLGSWCGLSAAPFLVWDLDGNQNSGPEIYSALVAAGHSGDYDTTITPYLSSLTNYCAIFICVGVQPDDEWLGNYPVAVDSLVSYLTNHDGKIYMEGGDTWFFVPTALHALFNIQGLINGFGDLNTILGQGGTFTAGMVFPYSGDNAFIDRLSPLSTAFVIFENNSPVYTCGIAYDDGPNLYKTVGTSFEFGGLVDGVPPSTKVALAESIMVGFFGCPPNDYDNDVAPISIDIGDYVLPLTPLAPQATVKNVGNFPAASFDVTCQIDGVYDETETVTNLLPDSTRQVTFTPDWTPGAAGANYDVTVFTNLAADENRTNDTLRKQVTSWDDRWYIISSYTTSLPTADGVIDPLEWQDATVRDVTDFLGRSGSPLPPGRAYLYVMNDADTVYFALDGIYDPAASEQDLFELFLEDNHSGSWPAFPDSSEGQLIMIHHPAGGPTCDFRSMMSDSTNLPYPVSMMAWAGDTEGNMQYELFIPLGTGNQELDASPGDTVGMWLSALDSTSLTGYAWWPTSSTVGGVSVNAHGDLILSDSTIIHDCGVDAIPQPPDTVQPGGTSPVQALVTNYGNARETFPVSCTIDGYSDVAQVNDLGPGSTATVNFTDWNVPPLNSVTYTVQVCCTVAGDVNPVNDCLQKSVLAESTIVHDGAVVSIDWPPDSVWYDTTYAPACSVRNMGNVPETFPVECLIDSYGDTALVVNLAPGAAAQVTFADWIVPDVAPDDTFYTMVVTTMVTDDDVPANDAMQKTIYAFRWVGIEEVLIVPRIPTVFGLSQNSPNPFHHTTHIRFQVSAPRDASLRVYDLSGSLVKTLVDGAQEPGYYTAVWDGRDQVGLEVPSGIYFYRLKAGDFTATRKLTVLR